MLPWPELEAERVRLDQAGLRRRIAPIGLTLVSVRGFGSRLGAAVRAQA